MSCAVSHIEHLVLIVGLSGAGKSTASRALSDFGFYAVDNLPAELVDEFLTLSSRTPERFSHTCLLLDVRSESSCTQFLGLFDSLKKSHSDVRLFFLDSDRDALVRRYSETRRPHPAFDRENDKTLSETVLREREILQPIKERANLVIDTSELTVHDLKRRLREVAAEFDTVPRGSLRVNFLSFGFKRGAPRDCDIIVDVRFLPNPHFVEHLREKTGREPEVAEYVLSAEHTEPFLEKYVSMLEYLIPLYTFEGKSYLNIGIGCTGGKHRSVALAEELANRISQGPAECVVSTMHRDSPSKDSQNA